MGDDDYEHWPEASKHWTQPAAPAAGYDSNNGLHIHSYLAANNPCATPQPEAACAPSAPQAVYYTQPTTAYAQPPQYYAIPQPMQQPMQQPMPQPMPQQMPQQQMYGGYPQPTYYSYPQPTQAPAGPVIAMAPPAQQLVSPPPEPEAKPEEAKPEAPVQTNTHFYVPRFTGCEQTPAFAQPSAWLGRTQAQVEEDNSKIAKAEGAWDARKMVPKDLPDGQMCWVVELDQSKTLRTFADIKGLNGCWKRDPRYEDAWYFIREKDEEKKK